MKARRTQFAMTIAALVLSVGAAGLSAFQLSQTEVARKFALPQPLFGSLPDPSVAEQEMLTLREKLQRPITLDCAQLPLSKAMEQIARDLDVSIQLDPEGLDEAGVVAEQEVSCLLRDLRGAVVLKQLLGPLHLTFVVRDGLVQVTSEEKSSEQLTTRLYHIRDLLDSSWARQPSKIPPEVAAAATTAMGMGNGGMLCGTGMMCGNGLISTSGIPVVPQPQTPQEAAAQEICDLICCTVAPDMWSDNGGCGTLSAYRGMLVVSQTEEIQAEVESLLNQLRRVEYSRPGDVIMVP